MRRLAIIVLAIVITLLSHAQAWAAAPEMQTSSSGTTEVGDDAEVTLQALSSGEMPTDPQVNAPGLRLMGTSAMPSQQVMIINGVRSDHRALTVTFTLHATQVGSFTVTPSVKVDGVRYNAPSTIIKVVAAGTLPRQQQGGGFNPFDPFGFFGNDPLAQQPETPHLLVDPKLGLAAPRGATAFLHAVVDKSRAVVGEQVTLTIYLYLDTEAREPDFTDAHEATSNDFVRKSLMKDDATSEDSGYAAVAGHYYVVKVLRRFALFPLKTGDLEIGPMSLTLVPRGGVRESDKLSVMVTDPPLAGRPAGFGSGDVGRFALSADVDPRTTERGSAVSVNVTLAGTGNLPSELPVPVQAGVKWLEPEVREKMNVEGHRYGGTRTFSYVVHVDQEGDLDLGEIALPFYDADARKYDVARASLGIVHVTHSDAAPLEKAAPAFPELPSVRRSLGGNKPRAQHLTDHAWSWPLLFAPPLSFVVVTATRRLRRRAREKAEARKHSPQALLRDKERAQQAALASDDAGAIDAATIRLIEAAVLAHLGKNLRAATGGALQRELENAGASAGLSHELKDLLASCEAARFAPDSASSSDARARAQQGRKVVGALAKTTRGSA